MTNLSSFFPNLNNKKEMQSQNWGNMLFYILWNI